MCSMGLIWRGAGARSQKTKYLGEESRDRERGRELGLMGTIILRASDGSRGFLDEEREREGERERERERERVF